MTRTRATLPGSHAPAGSEEASCSGRKTEGRTWAVELSGKSAAMCWSQGGTCENWKKTPEMNCSTRAIGVMIAEAERPFFARLETAMPSSVQAAEPSRVTQTKVSQSEPCGRDT